MTPQYELPPPRSAGVTACRWFVCLAARLVPARDRARVVEEWEAELWVLVRSNRARGRSITVRRTLAFCRGIVPYVLWASRHPSTTSPPRRKSHGMNTLAQDIRYGARSFARNPTFTAAVILTLGLGIGASNRPDERVESGVSASGPNAYHRCPVPSLRSPRSSLRQARPGSSTSLTSYPARQGVAFLTLGGVLLT